jgi:peptidoglycan/LPS O-acetylase OafA/YrhL
VSINAGVTGKAGASGGGRKRDPAVFGIRGLAALALLTVHVAMFSGLFGTKAFGTPRPPSNFLGAFFVSGFPSFIGVFFVLPAMYLYLPIAKAIIAGTPRPAQRNAFLRRLFRLLPAYYAMYAVTLVALNREAIDGLWYVLRPVLLLHVYLPNPVVPNMINGMEITWTVPSMVQWYLALPLIAWVVHRFAARGATPAIRARRLLLPVPILIVIGVGWLFLVKANGWDNRILFWWPQGFAPTIGIGMALAVLLALAQVSPKDTPKLFEVVAARPYAFWLGAVAVYLVNCARPFSVIGMDAIYSTSGLLVTYVMVALFGLLTALPLVTPGVRQPALVGLVLNNRPVVHLGRVSYGIYLWHFAVMHFYLQPGAVLGGHVRPIRELYGKVGFVELETVTVLGTVAIATLSYYLLERPLGAWADRTLPDPHPRAVAALRTPRRLPVTVPSSSVLDAEGAASAVAAAVVDREAIRSNLLELEDSPAKRLLAGADLTGETRARWEAAVADLSALWETFSAYSAVVDEAVTALDGSGRAPATELSRVTALLHGPSILTCEEPPPLAERDITDSGRQRLTVAAAVDHMNRLFRRTTELLARADTVWNEATSRLDEVRAALARAIALRPESGERPAAIAAVEAGLQRIVDTLRTDPLALWRDGRFDAAELDRLEQAAASLAVPALDPDGSHDRGSADA